ncbi:MAG: hypothetical protein D6701_05275, partial [Gemmatimonadetes bacterium]
DRLRVLFVVQGEGRGHLTQALALDAALARAGHRVVGAVVGCSRFRPLPAYFADAFRGRLTCVETPVLVQDRRSRGVSAWRTALHTALRLPAYLQAVWRVRSAIRRHRPDVVVNFYDLIGNFALALIPDRPAHVVVGHHYIFLHPDFRPPPCRPLAAFGLRLLTRASALRADLRLGLAFGPMRPHGRLRVVGPLLREAPAGGCGETVGGPAPRPWLVYVLNPGQAEDVRSWHRTRPGEPVLGFWDRPLPGPVALRPGLVFHPLDGRGYLDALARCRGLATTAGFEAVAEAAALGRPVLAVPTPGHVEQAWNAADAARAGVARTASEFRLDALMDAAARTPADGAASFAAWVEAARADAVRWIEAAVRARRRGASLPERLPAAEPQRSGAPACLKGVSGAGAGGLAVRGDPSATPR